MTEKPITLHPHEARAAAEGRLGLIVRPVVPQPIPFEPFSDPPSKEELESAGKPWWPRGGIHMEFWPCPIGQPGDRLWGREVFVQTHGPRGEKFKNCVYKADCKDRDGMVWHSVASDPDDVAWRYPVTMPRWASRFTFEVEAVECRRVHLIPADDAVDSGVGKNCGLGEHKRAFRLAWDSNYAKCGLGWDANPWAWFVRVRRVEG